MLPRQEKDGGLALADTPDFEELKKLMECPVCLEIPSPPIYTCRTGHAICKDCKPKLKNCALCKNVFTHTRSFALESIILAAKFFCSNRRGGCKAEGTPEELKKHHIVCPFRQLTCNFSFADKCDYSQVFIGDLHEHLKTVHNCEILEPVFETGEGLFEDKYCLDERHIAIAGPWSPSVFTFDDNHFAVEWSKTESIVNCGIYLIDDDTNPARYGVQITIRVPGKANGPRYEISTTVPSIREKGNDQAVCDVAIPLPFLKKLARVCENPVGVDWTAEYKLYKL